MSGPPPRSPQDLKRHLGLLDAVSIYVGIILGSGIFVAPAAVAAAAPEPLPAAALWVLGGAVAVCGALCYAECGARLPRTGGFYAFYREAFGEPVAFVGGWAALLVTYPASIAAIASVFARYSIAAVGLTSSRGREATLAASAVLVAGVLVVVGMRTGALAQRFLTVAKVLALGVLGAAALLGGRAVSAAPVPVAQDRDTGAAALLTALVVLLWTFDGWSDLSLVSGEVREPRRDLRRAAVVGTVVLVVLYATVQAAVSITLGPAASASSSVVADAVSSSLGRGAGTLVALLVATCTFGSALGTVLTSSRLGYAMSRDRVLPSFFGGLHPRWGTPARSATGLTVATLVYVGVAEFRTLLEFFSFAVWIFYGATAVALLVLRRRGVGEPLERRGGGGVIAPAVVLAAATVMTVGLAVRDPRRSAVGLGLLLLGFPVWLAWKWLALRGARKRRPGP